MHQLIPLFTIRTSNVKPLPQHNSVAHTLQRTHQSKPRLQHKRNFKTPRDAPTLRHLGHCHREQNNETVTEKNVANTNFRKSKNKPTLPSLLLVDNSSVRGNNNNN